MRLGNSQRLFARERETVDDAFAGDVVGITGNYDLLIGDTLASKDGVLFDEIPRFAPECFSFLHNKILANPVKELADDVFNYYETYIVNMFK
jgi:peptide chain release factor 3